MRHEGHGASWENGGSKGVGSGFGEGSARVDLTRVDGRRFSESIFASVDSCRWNDGMKVGDSIFASLRFALAVEPPSFDCWQ
jgi:hypothetical protein